MNRSRSKSGGGGHPRWFVRGDADGLAGLFVDNLLQLLLIAVLCPLVCGLPMELIISRILPAAAISILFGNVFYSWQAWRLAKASGRDDVTALPYGINTVSLIAYIFLIMGPVWRETGNIDLVWQAGIFACLAGGALELAGAFRPDPAVFPPRRAPRDPGGHRHYVYCNGVCVSDFCLTGSRAGAHDVNRIGLRHQSAPSVWVSGRIGSNSNRRSDSMGSALGRTSLVHSVN